MKPKDLTIVDILGLYKGLRDEVCSLDDLARIGVKPEFIATFGAFMKKEGLDSKRPDDVRAMLDRLAAHFIKTNTHGLS